MQQLCDEKIGFNAFYNLIPSGCLCFVKHEEVQANLFRLIVNPTDFTLHRHKFTSRNGRIYSANATHKFNHHPFRFVAPNLHILQPSLVKMQNLHHKSKYSNHFTSQQSEKQTEICHTTEMENLCIDIPKLQ